MPERASRHSVRRAAADLLGTSPLSLSELIDGLRARGLDLGPDATDAVRRAIEGDGRCYELGDDRWISVPRLLDGTAWSTIVPDALPVDDCLPVDPDLTLLGWWAVDRTLPLADPPGGALEYVDLDDGTAAFLGPPGWLAADDTTGALVLTVTEGVVALEGTARTAPSPDQVVAVRTAFEARADHDELVNRFDPENRVVLVTMPIDELLWEALVASRAAFDTPVVPIDVLLAAAGLERDEFTVGLMGTDWSAGHRLRRRRRLASLDDLDDAQLDAVDLVLGASFAIGDDAADALGAPDEEPEVARLLAILLGDPDVGAAFVGEHEMRGTPPEELAAFARRLLAQLDHDIASGPRWLLALALDRLGDAAGARTELEIAMASDTDHPLVLRALAACRADAGDAPGALVLLRRARLDTVADGDDESDEDAYDPLFVEIAPFATRPRPAARRNDRCPCGSGRKYKDCHLGKEQHPLLERSRWLYQKSRRYLLQGRHRDFRAEIAAAAADASGRGTEFLLELLDSELLDDVALHEGGVFGDFLAERDGILPDDETLLAAQWAFVDRSLFEVVAVDGDELSLRDLRTGDHLAVGNIQEHSSTRPGLLLLGRPLPVEDTWRAYAGFVPVGDHARDDMLAALDDGDPFELAATIGATFAFPTLQNTDGEPLVNHELTFRVPDTEQAAHAFARSTLHEQGDGKFTLVRDTVNQPDTVILSLRLEGDELLVRANSDRRADEARHLIARLVPDASFEDDDVRTVDDMLAAPREPSAEPDLDGDPDLAAMLDEVVRARELRWIDEPVPALRDLTPRQAADHPVAREDLERLLRGLDDRRLPGGFDTERLRALLGLDQPG